jgi:anti-sigma B factor antagonist/stage II sporulation protein AA (anti-sigma F factor antagonist)
VQIETRQFADTAVVAVVGRIDHRSAGQLEQALASVMAPAGARQGPVVLDFAGVEYISSVGLRVLMVVAKQMRALAAGFAIAGLQPVVAEIFTISRFDRVLDVHAGVPSALAKASAAALAAWQAAGMPPLASTPGP